jgi:hypothetical protein
MSTQPQHHHDHVIVDDVLKSIDVKIVSPDTVKVSLASPIPLPVQANDQLPFNLNGTVNVYFSPFNFSESPQSCRVNSVKGEWVNLTSNPPTGFIEARTFWVHAREILWVI